MFERVRALFEDGKEGELSGGRDELQIAVAALLIETAQVVETLGDGERRLIDRLLERRFGVSAEEARVLERVAEGRAERSIQLYGFVRTINDRLARERRVEIVEMLWEVAYADGVLDPLEDSLLRRISALIDVSDHERGASRLRVLERLGLVEEE